MFTKKFWFSLSLALMLAVLLIAPNAAPANALAVTTVKGRMGAEVQISPTQTPTDADRHLPRAAYAPDHNRFLVVWHNKWSGSRDVYGQLVDSHGKKIGSAFSISSGPGDRIQPAVAYSPGSDLFFVVYMHDVSATNDGSRYTIEAQRVSWNGGLIGAAITIETSPTVSFWSPKVAANGSFDEFAIVWGCVDIASGLASAIGIKAYTAAGTYVYGTILDSNGNPNNPDLVWNPVDKQYLVVWNRFNPTFKNVVIGDLRDDDYNRILPGIIIIYDDPSHNAFFPRVAYSNGYYGVVFDYEYSSTDHDIYASWVFHDGSTVLGPLLLDTSTNNDTKPVIAGTPVATGGQEYIILFQRAGVNGASVWMRPIASYLAGENREVCNYIFWDCTYPAITKGAGGYLMLYTLDSVGDQTVKQHVFGRMFWQFNLNLPQVLK